MEIIVHESVTRFEPHKELEMYFTLHVRATVDARDADCGELFKLVGEKVRFRVVKARSRNDDRS
jgi:hypothetical protein